MQEPKRVSASKLKTYEMCAFKYFMQYQLFVRGKAGFAAELGSALHRIYELWAQAALDGKDEEGNSLEDLEKNWKDMLLETGFRGLDSWRDCRHVGKVEKDCENCPAFKKGTCQIVNSDVNSFNGCPWNAWEEAKAMVSRVLADNSEAGIFVPSKKLLATEDKFNQDIEYKGKTYNINGIIDLVIELDEDTVEIIDYKTGRYKMSFNESQKDIQLMLYYLAARRMYPQYKNVFVTIMYVQGGIKQLTPAFGASTETQIMERLSKIWDDITEDEMPKRIMDKPSGHERPNHICRFMCDVEMCRAIHPSVKKHIEQGGEINEINSLADLGLEHLVDEDDSERS